MKKLVILFALLACGPAWAAFPTVSDSNSGADSNAVTSHSLVLPDTIAAGDVCVAVFTVDGSNNTITWDNTTAGAWTALYENQSTDPVDSFQASAFKKVMDGTEDSATLSIATASAEQDSWVVFCFAGTEGSINAVQGTVATGSDANPNPPSETASWGADDNLWFVVTSNDSGTNGAISAWPCADNQGQASGGTGSNVVTGWCTEQDASAANDPGTFTKAGSDGWVAATFAIQPGTSICIPCIQEYFNQNIRN